MLDDLVFWLACEDATDSHGGHSVTNVGAAAFVAGKVGDAVEVVRSPADYLSVANTAGLHPGTDDFAVSFWMYAHALDSPNSYQSVIGFGGTSAGDVGFNVAQRNDTNIYVHYADGTTRTELRLEPWQTTHPLGPETWLHIVVTFDRDGLMRLWVNGDAVASVSLPDSANPVDLQPGAAFLVGNGFANLFNGLVDEVAYWHRLLTDEEIGILYGSGSGVTYTDVAGGGAITGTGAIIDSGETISGQATVIINASGAVTDSGEAISGAGASLITGTGAVADGGGAIAGSGTVQASGTGAFADSGESIEAEASVTIAGTGAVTDAGEAAGGTGAAVVSGTGSITDGGEIISAGGGVHRTGTGALADAGETISGSGRAIVIGAGGAEDQSEQITASGETVVSGSAQVNEAGELVDADGRALISGAGAVLDRGETIRGVQITHELATIEALIQDAITLSATLSDVFTLEVALEDTLTLDTQLKD